MAPPLEVDLTNRRVRARMSGGVGGGRGTRLPTRFCPALIGYLRSRTRLWSVAGLWTGTLLIVFDLYGALVIFIPEYQVRNDFRLIYGAARAVLQHGFSHLYDFEAQKAATEALAAGVYWQPFLNPPPLVWLAMPFTALPFGVAIWLWTALLVASALLAWHLTAPGVGLTRAAHLALFFGL